MKSHVAMAMISVVFLLAGCSRENPRDQSSANELRQGSQEGITVATPPEAPATDKGAQAAMPQSDLRAGKSEPARMAPSARAASQKTSSPPPARAPASVTVPAGTVIAVRLDEPVSTATHKEGQTFSATVSEPVSVNGKVVIPHGATAQGVVIKSKQAGRVKGSAEMALQLSSVSVAGRKYPIEADLVTQETKGRGSRTAKGGGLGAGAGAIIGGIAGGGKGAAIGALAGGATGAAGTALTGERDVKLEAETPLTFRLAQPLVTNAGAAPTTREPMQAP